MSLSLRQNMLTGSIPAAFSVLTSLQFLYLGDNELSGPVSGIKLNFTTDFYRCELNGNFFYGAVVDPSLVRTHSWPL